MSKWVENHVVNAAEFYICTIIQNQKECLHALLLAKANFCLQLPEARFGWIHLQGSKTPCEHSSSHGLT